MQSQERKIIDQDLINIDGKIIFKNSKLKQFITGNIMIK